MLSREVIDALFPEGLLEPEEWEARYPARSLPEGALVTRFGPSPTGLIHIGGVYTASISKDLAHNSGGVYFVRVEDTDQQREVEGSEEQFARAFAAFGIESDEHEGDPWGPYHQSARETIYLSFARELLRNGRAYLDFSTKEELAEISAAQQRSKLPTGYYGKWATWREASDSEVSAALEEGRPYVIRFRAPGAALARVSYRDVIRGVLEQEDNRNDAVVIKSSDLPKRLPTYHFAHAVDDHLMRVNLVVRGEEWISSVPLHLQLFDALGFDRIDYAHVAPLMKQVGSSKRKLSKRKDPEASVDFYIESGYPSDAVLYYLRQLANGRLAELGFAAAAAEPLRLSDFGVAGPLMDLVKLESITADYIAELTSRQVLDAVETWADTYDEELAGILRKNSSLAERATDVERVGVTNPRKDLVKWSGYREAYGFFFDELFEPVDDIGDERLGGVDPVIVRGLAAGFVDGYVHSTDQPEWFSQVRDIAARLGFAATPKEYKQDPSAYPGAIREAANIIRVALTGSRKSPDLHAVAMVLGEDEVKRRVGALVS